MLDHPAARQDDEILHIVATLDDLHASTDSFATAASPCQAL